MTMNSANYDVFAKYYDVLMDKEVQSAAARWIDRTVLKLVGKRGILLDIACGTGTMCEMFAKMGYDVIGTDSSEEMLSEAMGKKLQSRLPVQYLCQDMRKLDMFGTFDVAVCTFDSLNHLPSEQDVFAAFEKVSLFSEIGGVFIFDVNTPFKHREVLKDNVFFYDTEQVSCVWQNFLNDDDSVQISLDFFEPDEENDCYYRENQSFCEIALPVEHVRRMLEETGFEVVGVYDGYTDTPASETTQRAVFCAVKRN